MPQTKRQIILSGVANFTTAFGGGAVLGKGIGVVSLPFIQLGSLVAFFFGSALGLVILFTLLKGHRREKELVISFLGPVSSGAMLALYHFQQNPEGVVEGWAGLLFFLLLTARFSFWFLSRILRSDRMATVNSGAVPLIEGLFHSGTILSLLAISAGWLKWGLVGTLCLDTIAQLVGATLDRSLHGKTTDPESAETSVKEETSIFRGTSIPSLISVFSLLTVAVQVTVFHVAHLFPQSLAVSLLGAFYFGLAAAGIGGSYLGIEFSEGGLLGSVQIGKNGGVQISNAILLSTVLLLLGYFLSSGHSSVHPWTVVAVVAMISALYEVFCFGILHKIGTESAKAGVQRAVAKAFGVMALSACVSMFLLRWMNSQRSSCLTLAVAATLASFFLLRTVVSGPSRLVTEERGSN